MEIDKAAINKILDKYSDSLNRDDFDFWISQWDDDGIQLPPDDPAVFGKEKISVRNKVYFDKYSWKMIIDNKESQVAGDLAFARGFYTATLTPKAGGDEIFIDGKFLTIFKRQADSSWKIYRDCFNSNVPSSS